MKKRLVYLLFLINLAIIIMWGLFLTKKIDRRVKEPVAVSRAALDTVNTGTGANTGTGDPIRTAFEKLNDAVNLMNTLKLYEYSSQLDSNFLPYTGAVYPLNLGSNDLYLSGNIASSASPVNAGYFNDLTLTNPLRGNVWKDSLKYEEGDTIPAMFLSEGYDNYLLYNALNAGILAESFGVTMNTATYNTGALTDGSRYFQAFYLKMADSITGVKFWQYTQGNFTADNFNGIALYSYDAGVITEVRRSANNGDYWKATSNTATAIPLTAKYYATPGLYFIGLIYNTSDAPAPQAPVIMACPTNYTFNFLDAHVYQTGQTDLPASLTLSTATNLLTPKWFILY